MRTKSRGLPSTRVRGAAPKRDLGLYLPGRPDENDRLDLAREAVGGARWLLTLAYQTLVGGPTLAVEMVDTQETAEQVNRLWFALTRRRVQNLRTMKKKKRPPRGKANDKYEDRGLMS